MNETRLGIDPLAHKKQKQIVTFDSIAMKYFDDKYLNKTNNQQMGRYNLHMKPIFDNKSINDIKHKDIDKLQRSLIKAAKTINGIIQLLSVIFNNAKVTNSSKPLKLTSRK